MKLLFLWLLQFVYFSHGSLLNGEDLPFSLNLKPQVKVEESEAFLEHEEKVDSDCDHQDEKGTLPDEQEATLIKKRQQREAVQKLVKDISNYAASRRRAKRELEERLILNNLAGGNEKMEVPKPIVRGDLICYQFGLFFLGWLYLSLIFILIATALSGK